MERVLSFFTETLSGTTYIVVVVISVILFFACIGYLAERSILRRKKQEQYAQAQPVSTGTPVGMSAVPNPSVSVAPSVSPQVPPASVLPTSNSQPTVAPVQQPAAPVRPTPMPTAAAPASAPLPSVSPVSTPSAAMPSTAANPTVVSQIATPTTAPQQVTPAAYPNMQPTVTPIPEIQVGSSQPGQPS